MRFRLPILILLLLSHAVLRCQIPVVKGDSLVLLEQGLKKLKRNVHITIAPGPVYGATQKLGFAVVPMLVYKLDKDDLLSPPSSTALLLYFDFNGSWSAALKQNFYWNHNKWRAFIAGGAGILQLRFYGIGRDTTVIGQGSDEYSWVRSTQGTATLSCYRRIIASLYGGLEYNYNHLTLEAEDSIGAIRLSKAGINSGEEIGESTFVPVFIWDNRDNVYWTTGGYYAGLNVQVSNRILFSSVNYNVVSGFANGYHPLLKSSRKLVLAWHLFFQSGWGDLPFSRYAAIGLGDNVTGYTRGKYVDRSELTGQAELRYDIWKFISVGGFAGTGKIFPAYERFGPSVWLHYGGIRLYANILPSYNIHLKIDFAAGRRDYGIHVGIGQGF